jgi:hypothetical protein
MLLVLRYPDLVRRNPLAIDPLTVDLNPLPRRGFFIIIALAFSERLSRCAEGWVQRLGLVQIGTRRSYQIVIWFRAPQGYSPRISPVSIIAVRRPVRIIRWSPPQWAAPPGIIRPFSGISPPKGIIATPIRPITVPVPISITSPITQVMRTSVPPGIVRTDAWMIRAISGSRRVEPWIDCAAAQAERPVRNHWRVTATEKASP